MDRAELSKRSVRKQYPLNYSAHKSDGHDALANFLSLLKWKSETMKSQSPAKIVLGKLGSVGRDRGLRDIARSLRDAGAEVVYLGLRQTPESFVAAVEQEDPDAVCITSHTSDDLVRELLENLRSAGEGAVATPVIVAGDDAGGLSGIGIAAVVETGASAEEIAAQVRQAVGGDRADGASAGSSQAERNIEDLLQKARSGSNRAVGRLLSALEDETDAGAELRKLLPDVASGTDSADGSHVIGIAGASGTGKSTLCSRLIEAASGKIRGPGRPKKSDAPPRRTAVLSADASSQRSGGAILGDRIRMTSSIQKPQSSVEDNVFFRSVASRGQNGGNTAWIPDAVKLLKAAGFDLIVVETSGDGHTDSLIAEVADTLVMVVTGDWGDSIQASKAGLLEFADIFVVNKADAQEGDSVCRDLERMLDMGFESSWRPPVLQTAAASGEGTADLWNLIEAHKMYGA